MPVNYELPRWTTPRRQSFDERQVKSQNPQRIVRSESDLPIISEATALEDSNVPTSDSSSSAESSSEQTEKRIVVRGKGLVLDNKRAWPWEH